VEQRVVKMSLSANDGNMTLKDKILDWGYQFKILFKRAWIQSSRENITNYVRLLNTIGTAFSIGFIFFKLGYSQSDIQSRTGLLQVVANFLAMTSLVKTMNLFGKERNIINREIENSLYGVSPYFMAKVLAELPSGIIFPSLFSVVIYPMTNLRGTISNFFSINLLLSFNSSSLGMAIGAIVPSLEIALEIGKAIMMIFIIFGGLYVNEMTLKNPLVLIPKISIVKQGFQALCINEFTGAKFYTEKAGELVSGMDILRRLSFQDKSLFQTLLFQALFCLLNFVVCYLALKKTTHRFKSITRNKDE